MQHCCWYIVFLFLTLIGIVFDFVRVENEWNEHRGSTKTSKTSLEPTFHCGKLEERFLKNCIDSFDSPFSSFWSLILGFETALIGSTKVCSFARVIFNR